MRVQSLGISFNWQKCKYLKQAWTNFSHVQCTQHPGSLACNEFILQAKEHLSIYTYHSFPLSVQGLNPGSSEIFCTHPDQHWCPPSFLYNMYQDITGVKQPGHGVKHPPPRSTTVKETVQLYLYSPSPVPSRHVMGWPLLLFLLPFHMWHAHYLTQCTSCHQRPISYILSPLMTNILSKHLFSSQMFVSAIYFLLLY
jgi:hypothetical protein